MRFFAALTLAAGLASGAHAYGVSPDQYKQGQAQDQQGAATLAVPPQPSTYPAPVPGQAPAIQMAPQPQAVPQDFNNFVPDDWAKAWKHYKWEEAKAAWEGKTALFADARAKVEYDQGHVPGAIPLPLGEFDKYYEMYKGRIKAAKTIITYCHGAGCKLSDKVAQKLYVDKGFKNTGAFFGGWPQWQQHNMPIEVGPEPKKR
jgi:rhodanese-related sulfurtransferase